MYSRSLHSWTQRSNGIVDAEDVCVASAAVLARENEATQVGVGEIGLTVISSAMVGEGSIWYLKAKYECLRLEVHGEDAGFTLSCLASTSYPDRRPGY